MLSLALIHLMASAAIQAPEFYVAPAGDDLGPGTIEAPFASLGRAQEAVRELKAAGLGVEAPITVHLRDGLYELDAPLSFGPQDSGLAAAPVIYSAYEGESPVITGGRRLTGFQVDDQGWWHLSIPEVARGEWQFSQLFVDGERRQRPRWPKQGWSFVTKEIAATPENAERGFDRFKFAKGDLDPTWSNLSDVEVMIIHIWSASRLRISEIDDARDIVTFTGPTRGASYWCGLQAGRRYLAENVREALSEPGEWYLDKPTGELIYIPMEGEDPETTEIVAPRLPYVLSLAGDPGLGMPVEHLQFRGLAFAHTAWNAPPEGHSFPQAEVNMGGAIRAVGTNDCVFEDCSIAHTGEYAIEFGEGCKRNTVANCDLYDMAAGGVKIGTQDIPADETNYAEDNTVIDCRIAHGGRMHPAAVGVWIGHSPGNRIEHNDIFDLYYTGISVGWRWGYAESLAHDNLIANNNVHDLGQGVLSDMGGIYTLGPSPGTVITHNYFHDVQSYEYGGWGIYFDEGTSEIRAEENLCVRTRTGGFHQHYGRENRFVNNILAFSEIGQIQRTRAEEHRSFTFERNIVLYDEGPLLHGNWTNDDMYLLDNNLYWNSAGEEVTFAGLSLADWQARGMDLGSVIADPLFTDPATDDFTLQAGSSTEGIGFKTWDLTDVGSRTAADRPDLPPATRAFPDRQEAPAFPISEDFEDAAVGAQAPGASTMEDTAVVTATARVSDENAAVGEHSLKFQDAADQEHNFNPHVYYQLNYTEGEMVASFDLWHGTGATLYHEWRKNAAPRYIVGPSITIDGAGVLRTGNRELVTVPLEQWITIEIHCAIGDAAAGEWSLWVTVPRGAKTVVWEGLWCDEAFDALNWYGFCANAEQEAVFYLDNLEVAARTE